MPPKAPGFQFTFYTGQIQKLNWFYTTAIA
jgi:hypothetical protein